jgi:hypothetical protein
MWSAVRRVVYRVSWLPLFSVATTVLGVYLTILFDDCQFPAPWIGMLVAPVGLLAGWRFAHSTLERPRFHFVSLICSVVTSPLLAMRASMLFRRSEELKGKTGLFSGLSEALEGLLYGCLCASTVAIAIGAVMILVDRWRRE